MTQDIGPPYTPEEIAVFGEGFPRRGLYCPRCNTYIPEFSALSDVDRHRIRRLCLEHRRELAMAELRAATGCSGRWAKIWVIHAGRPGTLFPGPPCPHCGKPLRTARARQCPHCLAQWHTG
ncbi:hypothetical protein [Tahibacter sp.]|uniref:hypothetical protein n=1 Tax=Tahibacter sp. TaxID=2056211 RepID=UPI0028C4F01B|nr:hypothetical protein [Tahibacter sp.]